MAVHDDPQLHATPLRLIFKHYLSLSGESPVALVLPHDAASYLALEHPRLPGSAQRGIKAEDGVTVLPNTLAPRDIGEQVSSDTATLVAYFGESEIRKRLRES